MSSSCAAGSEGPGRPLSRATLSITGVTCAGCARAVTGILSRTPGVTRAHVDLAGACAVVEGSARPEDLVAAIEQAGYAAELVERYPLGRGERHAG